jgi:hypothetical protein
MVPGNHDQVGREPVLEVRRPPATALVHIQDLTGGGIGDDDLNMRANVGLQLIVKLRVWEPRCPGWAP